MRSLWLILALVVAQLEDLLFNGFEGYQRDGPPLANLINPVNHHTGRSSASSLAASSSGSSLPSSVSGSKSSDTSSQDPSSSSSSSLSSSSSDDSGGGGLLGLGPPPSQSDGNQDIQEFTPISDQIIQSETRYYSFRVDTTQGFGSVYQFLIFITGNICRQPPNIKGNVNGLTVYYSFNATMFGDLEIGNKVVFENGYFESLAEVPLDMDTDDDESSSVEATPTSSVDDQFSNLYIAVQAAPNTNLSASWSYQIGVSQQDLVFQWDDRAWAQLVDTDSESALVVTGNLTTNNSMEDLNASSSHYNLYIFPETYKNKFASVNSSWCAIRNSVPLFEMKHVDTSYTSRNGFLQQQFFVEGLNSSTKYLAYLVSSFKGKDFGGAIYQPFEFSTMSSDACKLIYDLDFCSGVSYSVPNNPSYSRHDLKVLYDNNVIEMYQNFSKALQQVSCNTSDEAKFSPIVNCLDCDNSYRDWLCSVSIPRCTTRNESYYVFREFNQSRSDFINEQVSPPSAYFEILPCINNCNGLARDCPAQMQFTCPTKNISIIQSYYFYDRNSEYPMCNLVSRKIIEEDDSSTSSGGMIFGVSKWVVGIATLLLI